MNDRPDTGETVEADTLPHLRELDAATVAGFVHRGEALRDLIKITAEPLWFWWITVERETDGLRKEKTAHAAMRLAKLVRHVAKEAMPPPEEDREAEQQLAGIASGLAADIEAAVGKVSSHE